MAPEQATSRAVQRVYLVLLLLHTLAASFIWGVNTLFLLDAGLTNTEAFAANAFFAIGQVIFEVPTGVVADTRGRRFSLLLGAATLLAAMLVGSVAGGIVAQVTDLGVPYLLRAAMLGVTLLVAFRFMHDIGFSAKRGTSPVAEVKTVFNGAMAGGWRNPPVRWLMPAAPFTTGVGFYAFYALQPHLLELYGDPNAYSIAGLAAAVIAGAQIVGGLAVPWVRRPFTRRPPPFLLR